LIDKKSANDEVHSVLVIGGLNVDVIRKDIKNLHISVMPPNGRVRVAIPAHINDDRVRSAIVSKLAWIKKQQADFEKQPRQSEREMVSGESHYFLGRRYRLEVIEVTGKSHIALNGNNTLLLSTSTDTSKEKRLKLLDEWYREQIKRRLPALLNKWQAIVGVEPNHCGIRKMKTKWGSCNTSEKRIWLNLELAKKPPECLEYILVHELVHLLERHHNRRFKAFMDEFMPKWSLHRDTLNSSPLANENWIY
jgi:predicted metal-dependent hydrolase